LNTIDEVYPVNFKVAYAFAAIPSRYLLENRLWKEAANLKLHQTNFPWKDFQWQEAIVHFTRLMGSVHTGDLNSAKSELKELNRIHDWLLQQGNSYEANQVQIQIKASEAWMRFKEGNNGEALMLMNLAADMEDRTEKHPVTPGEVLPARELLGDMLLQMNKPGKALEAYEANLVKHPNRFNGLYGAGLAAERSGNQEKANFYYQALFNNVHQGNPERSELTTIKY
jgi:tetratricopeptide (TPR) repeat protein